MSTKSRPSVADRLPDEVLLSEAECAVLIGCAPHTLANRRCLGFDTPPFVKLTSGRSGRVRYRLSDVRGWIEKRVFTNTAGGRVEEVDQS